MTASAALASGRAAAHAWKAALAAPRTLRLRPAAPLPTRLCVASAWKEEVVGGHSSGDIY